MGFASLDPSYGLKALSPGDVSALARAVYQRGRIPFRAPKLGLAKVAAHGDRGSFEGVRCRAFHPWVDALTNRSSIAKMMVKLVFAKAIISARIAILSPRISEAVSCWNKSSLPDTPLGFKARK